MTQLLHASSCRTVKERVFLLGEAVGFGKVKGNSLSLYGILTRQDRKGSAVEEVDRQILSCPRAYANVFQTLLVSWGTIHAELGMVRQSRKTRCLRSMMFLGWSRAEAVK